MPRKQGDRERVREREKGGATRREGTSLAFARIDIGPAVRTLIPPFKREVSAVIFFGGLAGRLEPAKSRITAQFRAKHLEGYPALAVPAGRPSSTLGRL